MPALHTSRLQFSRLRLAIIAAVMVSVGVAFIATSHAAAQYTSVKSGAWSDPAVWGGSVPVVGDSVVIAAGTSVTYDIASLQVSGVTINPGGTLAFSPTLSTTLESSKNIVVNGTLSMHPA